MGRIGEAVEGYWSPRALREMMDGLGLFAQVEPAVQLTAVPWENGHFERTQEMVRLRLRLDWKLVVISYQVAWSSFPSLEGFLVAQ